MEVVQVFELLSVKLFLPFAKLFFCIGGWFASLLIQIVSPEEISKKELRYRLVSSIIAIPIVMAIDSKYDLEKWFISALSIGFGLFGWLVIDIAKKKVPKKLKDYIDNIK
jgi:uncharacterized membrane protein YjdF